MSGGVLRAQARRPRGSVPGPARAWGAAALIAALSGWPAPARAQPAAAASAPRTSSLGWSRLPGAEACIGAQELARAVEALLGRAVFVSASEAALAVEGRIAPDASGGWRATLAISDDRGRRLGGRELPSPDASCRALDEPVARAFALISDPGAGGAPRPPPPPPPPAPAPPEVIVRDRPVYVPVAAPPADPWRLAGRGAAALGLGMLPSIGLGLTGAVTLQPPIPVAFEATGALYLPSLIERDGASGELQLGRVGLTVCPLLGGFGRVELSACVGPAVGMIWGEGQDGGGESWEQHELLVQAEARGRLTLRLLGPVTAGAGFALIVPFVRDPFTADGRGGAEVELFRAAPVAAETDFAVGLQFP